MRIYLSQYNTGSIGECVEMPCTKEELQTAMSRVGEEYFISDSEDIPFEVEEYDNPWKLNEKLEEYEALMSMNRSVLPFCYLKAMTGNIALSIMRMSLCMLERSWRM